MTTNHQNINPELLARDVSIRSIDADDLSQIIEPTDIDPVTVKKWHKMLETGHMNMLVIYKDGVPAGRVNLVWTGAEEKPVIDEIGVIPTISALQINEEDRGRGLGWQLMTACEDLVRSRSHPERPPRLALGVKPDNKPAENYMKNLAIRITKLTNTSIICRHRKNPEIWILLSVMQDVF